MRESGKKPPAAGSETLPAYLTIGEWMLGAETYDRVVLRDAALLV